MNGPFYVNAVITAEQLPCPPSHKTIGSVSLPDWLNIIIHIPLIEHII